MELRSLTVADLERVQMLLGANDLPADDIRDPANEFMGAFEDDALVGTIGLQSCDGVALLRSLAVDPTRRKQGVARALCEHLFATVRMRNLGALYLLTTGAADYFARLGFAAVDRANVPASIRATAQFASLCPASAHVMCRASAA